MIHRPTSMNAFEFVRVATLRATQLTRGCLPRLAGGHRSVLTAQLEVAAGKVRAEARPGPGGAAAPARLWD
jgi:DNA-directed RNA polymerase subunit K/omega